MNAADYVLIVVVLASALVGVARGLLREIIAVITWVLALWLAWHLGGQLEPHLGGLLQAPAVRPWAARAIIAVVVLLAGGVIGALLAHFVRLSIFSATDRFFGFVFGMLRGVILVGVLVILGQLLHLQHEGWWERARLMPSAERAANVLRGLVGEERLRRAGGVL
ncbi:MAG: CvpA family protein [Gammaproteobacteria bacterium]|nr:CvpA family protein [Gammaproteobacteria bacterium]